MKSTVFWDKSFFAFSSDAMALASSFASTTILVYPNKSNFLTNAISSKNKNKISNLTSKNMTKRLLAPRNLCGISLCIFLFYQKDLRSFIFCDTIFYLYKV